MLLKELSVWIVSWPKPHFQMQGVALDKHPPGSRRVRDVRLGPMDGAFQPPVYCFPSLPPKGMSHQFWRNVAMNPQFNTFQISQGSPGKSATQDSKSKVLIPEEPHLVWSTLQKLWGWQTCHQLRREGVGRLWELHIWQRWMKLVLHPGCLQQLCWCWHCTEKPGGAAGRGRIYFRLLQNEHCSFTLCGGCSGFSRQSQSPVVSSLFREDNRDTVL